MSRRRALGYLELAKSTYLYAVKRRSRSPRAYRLDPALTTALQQLTGYELTLGYDKLTDYLRQKHRCIWNRKKVYKHMKALKLLQPRAPKRRWKQRKRLRACCPLASNVRWEMDLTWVPTQMGPMYLFVIEDTYDRAVVASAMELQCGAHQAVEVLRTALRARWGGEHAAALHLTVRVDRGCQFTAEAFGAYATGCGLALEFCGVQTPNDKPYIESFLSCYKREEVYRHEYASFFEAYEGWQRYVTWYNTARPHGSLNNRSPKQFREVKNLSTIST